MRKTCVWRVVLASIAVLCSACIPDGLFGARALPTRPAPALADVAWDDRSLFVEGLIQQEQAALESLAGATVYHLDLLLPEGFSRLEGSEQVRYTNRESVPLDEVYFRLYPNVTGGEIVVSGLQVDGRDVTPAYEVADSALRVPLPAALQPGEWTVIEMDFVVTIPMEMGAITGFLATLRTCWSWTRSTRRSPSMTTAAGGVSTRPRAMGT